LHGLVGRWTLRVKWDKLFNPPQSNIEIHGYMPTFSGTASSQQFVQSILCVPQLGKQRPLRN